MKKLILKIIIFTIIYILFKLISDTFLAGCIAGELMIFINIIIDEMESEDK